MSLINDALKKASETPAAAAQTNEPLQVAAHKPAARWPMFVLPSLLAVVFGAGAWLVVRGWDRTERVLAKEPVVLVSEQTAVPVPVATTPHPNPLPSDGRGTSTNMAAVPSFPTLKLQGLIWQPRRPSVVINGKSLFVGEKIERAMVTAITPDSVTLVWNGEQRVLTLR